MLHRRFHGVAGRFQGSFLVVCEVRVGLFVKADGLLVENKDGAVVLPGELNVRSVLLDLVQSGKVSGRLVQDRAGLVRLRVIGERRRGDGMAPCLLICLAGGLDLLNPVLLQEPGADDAASAVGARREW